MPGCSLFFPETPALLTCVSVMSSHADFFDHRTQSPDVPSGIFCKARLPPCRLGRTSDNEMPDNLCRCRLGMAMAAKETPSQFFVLSKEDPDTDANPK